MAETLETPQSVLWKRLNKSADGRQIARGIEEVQKTQVLNIR